jgi:hypothetical protein
MTKQAKLIFILAAVAGGALFFMRKQQAAAAVPTNNVTAPIVPDWWTFAGQWNGSVAGSN